MIQHSTAETIEYEVEHEYPSSGPIAATASADGRFVAIDFANLQDTSKALRLVFPADHLGSVASALLAAEKALADPGSGIHYHPPH